MRERRPFTTAYHTHFPLFISLRLGFGESVSYRVLRRFHRPAAVTIVSTASLARALAAQQFDHLEVVPLGVDTKRFIRNPHPAVPDLPHPVFVYCGRLAPEKNVEEFLSLSLPGSKLVIGDGPARPALEARYGSDATFVGYQHGSALVDWLSRGDVFVYPSRTETFGLVMIEALACGLPIAAHAVMGPCDIVEPGETGMLDENLAKAAQACLSLSRYACRASAERYSWDHSSSRFESVVSLASLRSVTA